MDIEGLGDKTVRQLVEKGFVTNIADLYDLAVDDVLKLEGFAEKSASQLYEAIQATKKPRLDRFLYALGIRHVGGPEARILAQHYQSLAELQKASKQDLEAIPEIGPEIAESVQHFFGQEVNQKVLKQLTGSGVEVQDMPAPKEQPLQGKTFVFTGGLEHYTRDEAREAVEMRGGRATSSVSGETDYVVVGADPGSKLEDAKKHKVQIIDEKEFRRLIEK
jgi:DNA ligase (NAD+)